MEGFEGFEGFSGGTPRERNLLIGLGVLVVGFVLWLLLRGGGGGGGIESNSAAGGDDLESALRDLQTVESTLASRPASGDTPARARQPLERATVVRQAQTAGLVISRLEPGPDGEIELAFDASPSPVIMRFLRDVSTNTAATITELDMDASADELVEASVTLQPMGPAN